MKKRPFQTCLATLPLAAAALTFLAVNGQCANPAYPSVVEADGALGYYRFNDALTRTGININSGSLGAAGNASNDLATITFGVVYSMPGAIVGDGDRASFFDYTTRTEIPFNSAVNTPNTQPFSVEAWMYPVSDQGATGMGALCNRWTQGGNRQGWVVYQRGANTNTSAYTAGPGLGWEFRMYNDLDTGTHLDVQSRVPFTLGKWQQLVVVYDPVGGDPLNATLTIYIDGVFANAVTNTTGVSGYGPCTGNHDPSQAVNGQPAMALGGYNNANSGTAGFANPWTGGVDEFAWYNAKLTPAQILAHYQNGTNAARSTPYATLIKSDNPVVYLRLNEVAPGPDTAFNVGDLRSAAHAANTAAIKHPGTSALAGRTEDGSHSGHYRDTSATGHALASIPWTAANNPDAGVPYTLEAWFRATGDQMNPGPCPINNRLANGIADRTGWIIYQRDPNLSYQGPPAVSGESGLGWTFRPYSGNGGNSGGDLQLAAPYNLGEWVHLVVTWEPFQDMGLMPSGSEQWMGVLTGYIDGVPVATNGDVFAATGPIYAANANPTADARTPADLAIGSYNAASGYGEEFEGDVDEVAFYNNCVLTPDQILAHYQTGTNAHPATNYATLVFNAAGDTYLANNPGVPIPEATTIPKTYLRFNEPAYFPATNSGSLGYLANGNLVLTTNIAAGPTSAGFEPGNSAVILDGTTKWVSLNNPLGLEVSGQITLEAWIKPDATQGNLARIISHGTPTPTVYDTNTYPLILSGSQLSSNEVFLRIEGAGATYAVGTSDGVTTHGASAAVTAGDLGGANGWIHLAGTYDGSRWNLYRNGVQIATTADTVGALPVTDGEWAIGATGMGWGDFYTGQVDEVAIYGTALSAATVKAHYYVGHNGPVSLAITRPGGVTTVTWPAGTLQQADAVTGPWSDLASASSPYNPPAGPTKKFYRVRL
jgi:hypothetical protein